MDTNALIALLSGNRNVLDILSTASWIGISVISELEFLSFSGMTENDEALFQQFKNRVEVLDLGTNNTLLIKMIVSTRRLNRIKLPDAIIATTAILQEATLLSNDLGFRNIPGLVIQNFDFGR